MKKFVYTYLFLLSILFFSTQCLSAQEKVSVSGKIQKGNFTAIMLTDYINGSELASSEIDAEGNFEMSLELTASSICKLGFDEKGYDGLKREFKVTKPG